MTLLRPDLPIYGNVGTLREFDPLLYPKTNDIDCIVSYPIFLEENGKRRMDDGTKGLNNHIKELENLKKKVEWITNVPVSKNDIKVEFIISICGYVIDDYCIDYLSSIDDEYLNKNVHCVVFQRPNIGWQWGSLEDIWIKYKDTNCKYFVSSEVDLEFLNEPYWYDECKELIKGDKICFISDIQKNPIDPHNYYGPLNSRTWKDKNNKTIEGYVDTTHTNGSYFIRSDFLDEMYKTYGCFTYALTANFELDAIVYGEIGFCQRAIELGYKWRIR